MLPRRVNAVIVAAIGLSLPSESDLFAAAAERDTQVVARSGNAVITVSALERRLTSLSSAERASLGGAPAEAPRRLLEQVLALELGAELEARARGLDKNAGFADRHREILRQAMDQELRNEALQRPVSAQEIGEFFEQQREHFEQPARIRIWRILVDDENAAQQILQEVKQAGDIATWSRLARERSIDTATRMRQGDLGFVRADGSTDVPRVRVDPALYQLVQGLKDGEIAPKPLAVAGKFAVLWRRGFLPQKVRALEQESDSIRRLLERRRVDELRQALLLELRKKSVRAERPELLELVAEGLVGETTAQPPLPERRPRPAEAGSEPPKPTERGLR